MQQEHRTLHIWHLQAKVDQMEKGHRSLQPGYLESLHRKEKGKEKEKEKDDVLRADPDIYPSCASGRFLPPKLVFGAKRLGQNGCIAGNLHEDGTHSGADAFGCQLDMEGSSGACVTKLMAVIA